MNRFDPSNRIHPTAIIHECVAMGKNNVIGAYTVIGANGEIRGKNQDEFKGSVILGDGNVISELVTIQRPFTDEATVIGDNNIIMAHSHVGHNSKIGDNCEICAGTVLCGYTTVGNRSKLKIGVTVRNRKTIGEDVIVGMGSVVVSDIESGKVVVGNPAKPIKEKQ